jgi:DNA-3-methyladenine glycosylase
MLEKRRGKTGTEATNGPAKLCQALAIDKQLNGHDLRTGALRLIPQKSLSQTDIVQTTRIGIARGQDVPWRFYIKGDPYVSKP